jgi:hypothetical protein
MLVQLKSELIDENLFVEALTLCALNNKEDKELNAAINSFDQKQHEEPDKSSLRICL